MEQLVNNYRNMDEHQLAYLDILSLQPEFNIQEVWSFVPAEMTQSQNSLFPLVDPNDVCPMQPTIDEVCSPKARASSSKLEIKHSVNHNQQKPGMSSKKLTVRERQLELQRQEAHQLQLRDYYLTTIRNLESKCNKLRNILKDLVVTSPKFDNQLMDQLDRLELWKDCNKFNPAQ